MSKLKIKICAVLLSFISLFGLCACGNSDSYEFERGFYHFTYLPNIMAAARSKKRDLPIDNLEFELFYGGHILDYAYGPDGETVGVNIYICNFNYLDEIKMYDESQAGSPHVLYDSINFEQSEGIYFYKFISTEEFNSGKYEVTTHWGTQTYKHSEKASVPNGVLEGEEGSFCFAFIEWAYLKEKEKYCITMINTLKIYYEKLGNNMIRLK